MQRQRLQMICAASGLAGDEYSVRAFADMSAASVFADDEYSVSVQVMYALSRKIAAHPIGLKVRHAFTFSHPAHPPPFMDG